jgi:hypothetical protein
MTPCSTLFDDYFLRTGLQKDITANASTQKNAIV